MYIVHSDKNTRIFRQVEFDIEEVNEFILPDNCKAPIVQEIAIKLIEHVIRTKSIITYGDLTKKLSFEMNPRNVEKPLGKISYACIENGLPPISVVVVNKDDLMPGKGFYNAYTLGMDESKQMAQAILWMKEVLEYDSWGNLLVAFKE